MKRSLKGRHCQSLELQFFDLTFTNMASKQFYFIGDEPSTATPVSIDVAGDVKALRQAVANSLHVADSSGMGFRSVAQILRVVVLH